MRNIQKISLICCMIMFCGTSIPCRADFFVQRYEDGVETPSFENAYEYIKTTPEEKKPEVEVNTTNNYYNMTPYYYPSVSTYRVVAPPVYYGSYPYGGYYGGSSVNMNVNFGRNNIQPPPPPKNNGNKNHPPLAPSNTVPPGRYTPYSPVITPTSYNGSPTPPSYITPSTLRGMGLVTPQGVRN